MGLKMEKKEFKIGKWYKTNNNYYIKISRIEKLLNYNKLHGETIYADGVYRKESYWANNSMEKECLENGILTNLSEIKHFLPPNHPDLQLIETINNFEIW